MLDGTLTQMYPVSSTLGIYDIMSLVFVTDGPGGPFIRTPPACGQLLLTSFKKLPPNVVENMRINKKYLLCAASVISPRACIFEGLCADAYPASVDQKL